MENKIDITICSEIGKLESVLIHTPGPEVENMTPENAERALYSDILNLSVAREEYAKLELVLKKVTNVYQIKDLLVEALKDEPAKINLINTVCENNEMAEVKEFLEDQTPKELAKLLIEGVSLQKNSLTKFLSKERYALPPLHNFFFTRDPAMVVFDMVLVGKMAKNVRVRESLIMETVFNSANFNSPLIKKMPDSFDISATIEGGDLLVAREDVLVIGIGPRTSSRGIDNLIEILKNTDTGNRYIIVQELPHSPESFIHLDMVFTFMDSENCMIYEPVIMATSKFQTVLITITNGKVASIKEKRNLPEALKSLGVDLKPVFCGGRTDHWIQEREQWHSGANLFAFAPGKLIGYGRNRNTLDELSKNGYEIVGADDIISEKIDYKNYEKIMVTLDGSELPRGGGGARCMTMPLRREPVR